MRTVVDGLELTAIAGRPIAMECDKCGKVHKNRTDVRNADNWAQIALRDGWTFTGNGGWNEKHFCPECTALNNPLPDCPRPETKRPHSNQ